MKMTEKEYRELVAHLEFIADKAEDCYRREVEQLLEDLKKKYKQYVL